MIDWIYLNSKKNFQIQNYFAPLASEEQETIRAVAWVAFGALSCALAALFIYKDYQSACRSWKRTPKAEIERPDPPPERKKSTPRTLEAQATENSPPERKKSMPLTPELLNLIDGIEHFAIRKKTPTDLASNFALFLFHFTIQEHKTKLDGSSTLLYVVNHTKSHLSRYSPEKKNRVYVSIKEQLSSLFTKEKRMLDALEIESCKKKVDTVVIQLL